MCMPASASSRRRASVVLPAPEGDERTMSRPRRPMRTVSLPLDLFNILNLLAHLVDDGLELETSSRCICVAGLGAQCVGFAIELLRQKVEATAGRLVQHQQLARRAYVGSQPLELLLGIRPGRKQRGLLVEARFIECSATVQQSAHLLLEPLLDGSGGPRRQALAGAGQALDRREPG